MLYQSVNTSFHNITILYYHCLLAASALALHITIHQLQAQQRLKITTTPHHFDYSEAIALGYQNTMELVNEDGQQGCNDSSFLNMLTLVCVELGTNEFVLWTF